MSRRARVWLIVLGVLVITLGGMVWYLRPIAPVATGYAAKNACSGIFIAGRTAASVKEDLPANPLIALLRTTVDTEQEFVKTSLLGFSPTWAWYTPGLGCTIADERPDFTALPDLPEPPADERWPEGQGAGDASAVDRAALQSALDDAFAEDDPEGRAQGTRAVVVVRDGRIVAERYADGFDADTAQLGWSMTKSVTNTLAGRLLHEGRMTLDTPPGIWPDDDPRSAITFDHLLHMTDGLDWEESYGIQGDVTTMLYKQPDASAYAAAKPLAHDPGTFRNYSSGTTNLLCEALHEATGEGLDLARAMLFEPLGMRSAQMEADAAGGLVCSSFMYATPRDWARLGLLFLRDGEWAGKRLLPEDWIEYTTEPVALPTTEADAHEGYGALWYTNTRPDGSLWYPGMPRDAFWMSGHDGQRVAVVPSADLVVVRMGFTPDLTAEEWGFEELVGDVVAAVG